MTIVAFSNFEITDKVQTPADDSHPWSTESALDVIEGEVEEMINESLLAGSAVAVSKNVPELEE